MTPKRHLFRRAFLGSAAALAAAGTARAADSYTLRLNNVARTVTDPFFVASAHFAQAVERKSNGRLKIEIYPNLQLGTERDSIGSLVSGVLDLTIQSTAEVASLVPKVQVFDLPFMFRDLNAAFRVFDGPVGGEFFGDLANRGIYGLALAAGGFKQLETTSRSISVPDDMKGLRIRTQASAVYVATYQSLGAVPVTIDLAETFVALSQHTVDGMEISLSATANGKFYTVIRHIAMTNHALAVVALMDSKKKIDALPADLVKILRDEAKPFATLWRQLVIQQNAAAVQILKDNGVAFTETQYGAFRAAVEPVYALYRPKLGADFVDRVSKAAAS